MNLLITRHDKIGDFCVTLPLFKAIKEQYPNTKVTALVSKEYIEKNLDFKATIFDSRISLYEFTRYLACSFLFVSTSTGPMHLAGASNTKTLSFFGNSLFASSKRWATISSLENQNNFMLSADYSKEDYLKIEKKLEEIISE